MSNIDLNKFPQKSLDIPNAKCIKVIVRPKKNLEVEVVQRVF